MQTRRQIIRGAGTLAAASLSSALGRAQPADAPAAVCARVVELARANFIFPARVEEALATHRHALEAAATPAEATRAIDDFLAALGLSHTARYAPSSLDYYENLDIYRPRGPRTLAAAFPPDGAVAYAGVGIATETFGSASFVTAVYADTPAEAAGFLAGDEIVGLDGKPFRPNDPMSGPLGAERIVSVRRRKDAPLVEISVKVASLRPSDVLLASVRKSARVVESEGRRFAYLRMWAYHSEAIRNQVDRSLSQEPLASADGLILDLRCRWGGARPDAVNTFLGKAPEFVTTSRDGRRRSSRLGRCGRPMVAIVNHRTRSGTEVLAHSLAANGVPLVGSRTAGAVAGGQAFLLDDDSLLLLAVQTVEVDGATLEGVGVEPPLASPYDLPYSAGADRQLEAAAALLRRMTGRTSAQ
ncbi:carboxyl-terminal protease [Methylosinus sporium]|uniref:Carboxyl-terminal protease n=1 Tax=Methylosinus sporium TaxID=428 RepID=A0A549SF45_METSR|nr:S41 family peptidase [Methylosinus sporium]TRL27775.1 carboxyl-terminal protease [Methylosinus sporium]